MPIFPFQDGGAIALKAGDNVILRAASNDRRSLDNLVVHNTLAVSGKRVTFYKSPDDTSAAGKEVDSFLLGSRETFIPQIVGIALKANERLIAVTDAAVDAIVVTPTYSIASGTS